MEYSSIYCETTASLWFNSKDEATNFEADICHNNNFQYFEYKAKLLRNAVAQPAPNQANKTLRNATIAVPLINCKVELNLKKLDFLKVVSSGGSW